MIFFGTLIIEHTYTVVFGITLIKFSPTCHGWLLSISNKLITFFIIWKNYLHGWLIWFFSIVFRNCFHKQDAQIIPHIVMLPTRSSRVMYSFLMSNFLFLFNYFKFYNIYMYGCQIHLLGHEILGGWQENQTRVNIIGNEIVISCMQFM